MEYKGGDRVRKTAVLLAAALLLLTVCPAGAETYVYQALGFENRRSPRIFPMGWNRT